MRAAAHTRLNFQGFQAALRDVAIARYARVKPSADFQGPAAKAYHFMMTHSKSLPMSVFSIMQRVSSMLVTVVFDFAAARITRWLKR